MTDHPPTIKEVPLPKSECIRKFRLWDFDHERVFVSLKDCFRKKLKKRIERGGTRPAYFGMSKKFRHKWMVWFTRKKPIELSRLFWLGAAAGVSFEELEKGVEWVVTGKGGQSAGGGRHLYAKFPLELTPETIRLLMYFMTNYTMRGPLDRRPAFDVLPYRKDTREIFLKDIPSCIGTFVPELKRKPKVRMACINCDRLFAVSHKKCPKCGTKLVRKTYYTYPFPMIMVELLAAWIAKGERAEVAAVMKRILTKDKFVPKIACVTDAHKVACMKALCDNTFTGLGDHVGFNCGDALIDDFCELLDGFKVPFSILSEDGRDEPSVTPLHMGVFCKGGKLELESERNRHLARDMMERYADRLASRPRAGGARFGNFGAKRTLINVGFRSSGRCTCGALLAKRTFKKCIVEAGGAKKEFDKVQLKVCHECGKKYVCYKEWARGRTPSYYRGKGTVGGSMW